MKKKSQEWLINDRVHKNQVIIKMLQEINDVITLFMVGFKPK
jgi:hypothetical protein